ncbi:putative recombination initiation protein NBS1 [Trypanosoma cruzi]|uniref:Putative recombination initiation protein NBS1 n=1 Tax=Trypanosoma cruzi TaxID=5693 RepID=A0A2V2VB92_TRYCR|nr:putative recombination initiation protein NBS1 [Trypanosoma cruzi]
MRVLEVNCGRGDVRRHFLLAGETYTVGRKECRLPLPNGDPSISRHHATITVRAVSPYDVLDPNTEMDVSVTDRSKHGTLVNNELIGRENGCFVYREDTIKFGRRVTARVLSTALILVASSKLNEAERLLLLSDAVSLGASILHEPVLPRETFFHMQIDCIGFLYVTQDGYEMTPEVLLAMTHQYHVTTPSYVRSLVEKLREDSAVSPLQFASPTLARSISSKFPVEEHIPPLRSFYNVGEFLLALPQSPPRRLLRSYAFFIADTKLNSRYESLLDHSGALVAFMPPEKTTMAWPSTHEKTTMALVSDDMFTRIAVKFGVNHDHRSKGNGVDESANSPLGSDGGNNHASNGRYRCDVADHGRVSTPHNDPIESAYITLYNAGICLIPETNVLRAIFIGDTLELNEKPSAFCLRRVDEACAKAAEANEETAVAAELPKAASTETAFYDRVSNENCSVTPSTFSPYMAAALQLEKRSNFLSPPPPPPPTEAHGGGPLRDMMTNRDQHYACKRTSVKTVRGKKESPCAANGECEGEEPPKTPREREERRPEGAQQQQQQQPVASCVGHTHANNTNTTAVTKLRAFESSDVRPATAEVNALERKPVVVHAASQMNGSNTGVSLLSRQRVTAHKLFVPPPLFRSPSSVLMSSRSMSYQPSKDSEFAPHAESLEKQKERCHTSEGVDSGSMVGVPRHEYPASSQPASRNSSIGSHQHSEVSGSTSRRTSFGEPVRAPNPHPVGRTHSKSISSARPLQRQKSCPSSAVCHAWDKRQTPSNGRDASPLASFNTGGRRFSDSALSARQHHSVAHKKCNNNNNNNREKQQEQTANFNTTGGAPSTVPSSGDIARHQDALLGKRCVEFMSGFFGEFSVSVEDTCWHCLKQGQVDAKSREFLEIGAVRVMEFLRCIQRMERDIPPSYSTETTRGHVYEVRKRALATLRRILSTCDSVRSQLLFTLKELCDAVSCRPPSASRSLRSRRASVPYERKSSLCGN